MSRVFYKDLVLDVDGKNVYEPREDSFLAADNLNAKAGEKILEIGTGCGLLAILAATKGAEVVATDINELAVECAQKNAGENKLKIDFRVGDLFSPIKNNEKFDLIIFNPPYLPSEKDFVDRQIDLSYNSSETLRKFLASYKGFLKENGRAVVVNSSISGVSAGGRELASQKLAFEKISLIELKNPGKETD